MKKIFFGLVIILLIIVLQNWQSVNLQILFWQVRISQILLLLIVFLLGISVGYFLRKKF